MTLSDPTCWMRVRVRKMRVGVVLLTRSCPRSHGGSVAEPDFRQVS